MFRIKLNSLLASTLILLSCSANAGLYTDDLSRCLVSSTTSEDKVNLVKWMFSAASLHPSVESIASVTPQQLDQANKKTAELFVTLITEKCKTQTAEAMKYEGQVALQSSFQALGQVAAAELFSHPNVTAGMAGLDKHMDVEKLKEVFKTE